MALDSKPSVFFIFWLQEKVRVCMLVGPARRPAWGRRERGGEQSGQTAKGMRNLQPVSTVSHGEEVVNAHSASSACQVEIMHFELIQ